MRAFILGVAAAALLAVAAATVLDAGIQRSTEQHNQTEGVRL